MPLANFWMADIFIYQHISGGIDGLKSKLMIC